MEIRNALKKGEICPIIEREDKLYLVGSEGRCLDITSKLTKDEIILAKHLHQGLGVVRNDKQIDVCFSVNYHVHSEYSLLDGMSRLPDIAKKSSGVTALTDHGNMYGFLKFQQAMKKEGKKFILGCELYVKDFMGEYNGNHLIALAKNDIGRYNLQTLCSMGFYDSYNGKPYVSLELLDKHKEGLIITSACLGGEIAQTIVDDYDRAREVAELYKEVFGDDYYLEIQRHGIAKEDIINPLIVQLGKELGIKVVAANDSHYLNREDAKEHEMLLCISTKKKLNEEHFNFEGFNYHYMTDDEFVNLWWDMPEVITNAYEIALKCNVEVETGVLHLPDFEIPEGFKNPEEYLKHLAKEGFVKRFAGTAHLNNKVYTDRLDYELSVILNMGFCTYFLIVADYIGWAKANGIAVGAGRGSAAGSLLAYCLGITELDPIEYDLFFERFLNPARVSMPDIDTDFEDSRRGEVIEYVKNKYGADNVCNIITFGRLGAKQSLKDVARVNDVTFVGDKMSKLIPEVPGIKLDAAIQEVSELDTLIASNADAKRVFEGAKKLEGNTRQTSQHACGVVISDKPIRTYMPTCLVKEKIDGKETGNIVLVTQVTAPEVEELGLLKMDFLGLKTMSVIKQTLELVNAEKKSKGLPVIANYRDITLYDPYVYRDIARGKSFAVFQIESVGMRKFMSELYSDFAKKIARIESRYGLSGFSDELDADYMAEMKALGREGFDRMIAGVSLYRPGPMDYIPDYIKGINNPDEIVYDTPLLEPILKATYGVTVYQEQVMQIVQELAGFSLASADWIRKAMGKKKQDILDEYKPYFIYGSGDAVDSHTGKALNIPGCISKGISEEVATRVWDKMSDFAKYAFNKSHAAAYAVLTVTCGWLKYYYPTYYMCSMLNVYIDHSDKLKGYIKVSQDMGIDILCPDINKSAEGFTVEGNAVRFGLKGLKGVNAVVSDVIAERETNGTYICFNDLLYRTSLNKTALSSLIYSGALKDFGYTRHTLIDNLEKSIKRASNIRKNRASGQLELFNMSASDDFDDVAEYSPKEILDNEFSVSGIYLSGHPLDEYEAFAGMSDTLDIGFIVDDEGNCTVNGNVTLFGMITEYKILQTKKDGRNMCSFTIEDKTGSIKAVCFADDFANISYALSLGAVLLFKGYISKSEDFGIQVIVKSCAKAEKEITSEVNNVFVKLESFDLIEELEDTLSHYEGEVSVKVQINRQLYELKNKVKASSQLFMALSKRYGKECVLYR